MPGGVPAAVPDARGRGDRAPAHGAPAARAHALPVGGEAAPAQGGEGAAWARRRAAVQARGPAWQLRAPTPPITPVPNHHCRAHPPWVAARPPRHSNSWCTSCRRTTCSSARCRRCWARHTRCAGRRNRRRGGLGALRARTAARAAFTPRMPLPAQCLQPAVRHTTRPHRPMATPRQRSSGRRTREALTCARAPSTRPLAAPTREPASCRVAAQGACCAAASLTLLSLR